LNFNNKRWKQPMHFWKANTKEDILNTVFYKSQQNKFYSLCIQADNMCRPMFFRPYSGHKKCMSRGSYTSKS
jgi:hypothetical protein